MKLTKEEYKKAIKLKSLHQLNWIVSWNTIWTAYFRDWKNFTTEHIEEMNTEEILDRL